MPVLAPLLGTIALAPVFVGVAALAPTPGAAPALAAAGFLWLALGELLTGRSLLFGVPDGALPRARLGGLDQRRRVRCARRRCVSGPALLPALVWAGFALVLPLLVRGRWPMAVDFLGAALWVAGLIAAHVALADLLADHHRARQRARGRGGLDRRRGARARGVPHAPARASVATASRDHGLGLPCWSPP